MDSDEETKTPAAMDPDEETKTPAPPVDGMLELSLAGAPPPQELTSASPLQRCWGVWGSTPPAPKGRGQKAAEAPPPQKWGTFDTVCGMWRWLNSSTLVPSTVAAGATLFIFQDGVAPLWEDPANANGGRWTYMAGERPDEAWLYLCLGVFGEAFDPEGDVLGVVLAKRRDYTRLSIWTKDRMREEAIMAIGRHAKAILDEAPSGGGETKKDDAGSRPGARRGAGLTLPFRPAAQPLLEYQDHNTVHANYRYVLKTT